MTTDLETRRLNLGEAVYDEEGQILGIVRGLDESGFYVRAEEDVEVLSAEPAEGGATDARMWRCWECGEMGEIEEMPDECPACGAPKEDLYYWTED